MNKIVFDHNEIEVINCYPFKYDYGKEVLRITISSRNPDIFREIKLLDGYNGIIQYYESDILITEYEMYSSDFSCGYMNGIYNVELTKVGLTEQAVVSLQSQIDEIVTEVIPAIVGI